MKLRGKVSLCRTCGEVFTTVSTFDRHRVGTHGVDRHCLTVAELESGGFARNQHGRWYRVNTRAARAYPIQGAAISTDPLPLPRPTDTSTVVLP